MTVSDARDRRGLLVRALRGNWEREVRTAHAYRILAQREDDPRVRGILERLAEVEERHAERWGGRLRELGEEPGNAEDVRLRVERWLGAGIPRDAALQRLEADEERYAKLYGEQLEGLADEETRSLLRSMQAEESDHARVLRAIRRTGNREPRAALDALLRREHWHATGGNWVGDAIYGVNDGLGAVFGIVSGVAGYSHGGHVVLVSGLAGMLASALSMGSGAYLASKSEREVYQAQIERERAEIAEAPEEEREEMELFYQLKGFDPDEARRLVDRLAEDPEQFLRTMAHEELGLSEARFPNPVTSALSATLSTAVGAFIPIIPFFFWDGTPAVVAAAVVSLVAHFAVGAGKAVIFGLPSWVRAGTEMTVVGAVEGAITYLIGLWGAQLLPR
jgi:VIT1/CCC1 family predicted Fe2+/Mn2+ transporter/rubrerythrin